MSSGRTWGSAGMTRAGAAANGEGAAAWRARELATAAAKPAWYGPRMTPSSVTIPVMSSAGVISNEGLRTSVSGGAIRTPRNERTSSAFRYSIGIADPSGVARSTELVGAHT